MAKKILGLNEDNIRQLYLDKRLSTIQVALHLGCSDEAVRKAMKRWGISRRTRTEALKGKPKLPDHQMKIRVHLLVLNARQKGDKHPTWRGGRYIDSDGYVLLRVGGRTVKEHRYVMEQHLGRPLLQGEHIHHKDGNKANNVVTNLVVMFPSEHLKLEWLDKERRASMSAKMKEVRAKKYWSSHKKKVD